MHASVAARTAYSSANRPTRSPRVLETETIASVTSELARVSGMERPAFAEVVAAIHRNRTLWHFLAAAVADEANALPPEARANIFYLAEFTETHSRRVLAGEASPGVLVDINRHVLAGLAKGTDA